MRIFNFKQFINESNEKLSRNIWALRIDKNIRVSELKNYSFHRINQLNSNSDFRFEFNTPENYLYRFESSNFRTANSTRIRLIDLGKRSDDIEVESQRLKFAVERLFSTIKLIEYKKATQAENLGKSWQRLKDVFR